MFLLERSDVREWLLERRAEDEELRAEQANERLRRRRKGPRKLQRDGTAAPGAAPRRAVSIEEVV